MKSAAFPPLSELELDGDDDAPRLGEAAPARGRIRVLKIALTVLFVALAARAVQLSVIGLGQAPGKHAEAAAPLIHRADLVDRNGVLLATTVPGFALVAEPARVWDAPSVARSLAAHLPGLDAAETLDKLRGGKALVFLKRDLTAHQKEEIFALGLPGVDFREQPRRVYPQGDLAVHALGGAGADMVGNGGLELGLDKQIRQTGEANAVVRLSLDVRVQHALETELRNAVKATDALGGAGIVMDGRTGEVLAIASAPDFDANAPPPMSDDRHRLDRAAGAVYEMGSTLKPFTIAMALDAGLTKPNETFDLSKPISLQGYEITDLEKMGAGVPLPKALAASSNIMAATLALRLGAERQRAALTKLGLDARSGLELPQSERPNMPKDKSPLTTATIGYGHGMGVTLAALAGAYTVFANDGARVTPTLLARAPGDEVRKTPVFTPGSTHAVIAMMREVVTGGTGKHANLAGIDLAGKTGSANKPIKGGGYSSDRMLSSFAAIFPARDPHYVMVVALDEPKRVAAFGKAATGGAVAAPLAARVAERIAPLLGMTSDDGGESP